jgi:thiosulfate/3-mercaptopyruvate sulfurtransferase
LAEHLLVSTQWLAEHLSDTDLRIVDIRGHIIPPTEPLPNYFNHHGDYLKSHIPGAVFVDWVHEITDPDDPRHAKIAKPKRFAEAMSRAGIGPETFVVAYDDASAMFAARLWWALNYFGHHNVAVLDGGWKKWIAEQRPVTAAETHVEPSRFIARPDAAWIQTGDQVLKKLHGEIRLVDVRSRDEFTGKTSRAKRKGHIPGAVNRPRPDLTAADGTVLPPEALREKFAEVGVSGSEPEVIFYCNSGVSASFGLLASKVAGFKNGIMYDGSWKDWANDDAKPIEG